MIRLVNQHFTQLWKQHDPEGRKNRGGVDQPDAPPPLEVEPRAEGASGVVSDAMPRATPALRCLQATERVSGAKEHQGQASRQDAAPGCLRYWSSLPTAPRMRWPARLSPGWSRLCGCAFFQIERHYRGPHTKMEMLSRRAYGFRNFENDRLRGFGPMQLEWSD